MGKFDSMKGAALATAMRSLCLPAAGVLAAFPVQGASSLDVEEVVVTSRRVEEGLQNAPIAVSAFTAVELENRGALDIQDVAAASPNVNFQAGGATSGMSAAPTVFIRGIGQSDFNINNDPAVGMYIDGVYLGRMIGSLTELLDLERAEVLRGPQGTLFGRNSIGGAINLITKKADPGEPFHGQMIVSSGQRDYAYAKASANIPVSETVAARVSGFLRKRDGYVKAVQYDDLMLGEEDVWGVHGAFRVLMGDNVTLDVAADYSERRDSPAPIVPTQLGNVSADPGALGNTGLSTDRSTWPSAWRFNTGTAAPADVGAPVPPPPAAWVSSDLATCSGTTAQINSSLDCYGAAHLLGDEQVNSVWYDRNGNRVTPVQALDLTGGSATLTWDLGAGELKAISAYREMDASFNNDNDFTPFIIFHNLNEEFSQSQFSQEIQFAGSALGDRLDYVTGLYYFEEEGSQAVTLLAPMLPPAGAPPMAASLPYFQTERREIDNQSMAAFGQATVHMGERVHLTAGVRYTDNEKAIAIRQTRAFNPNSDPGTPGVEFRTGEQTAAEWNAQINLSVDLSDDVMTYVQYANGFRDGGFPVRFPGLPTLPDLTDVSFGPEFVDAYELGLKSSWLEGTLRMNAAAFMTLYDDMQVEFSDPALNGAPNTSNVAQAGIKGVEVELNYLITDNLRLDLAGGYLDAQLEDIVGGGLISGADNTSTVITESNALPYAPEWQINTGVNHIVNLPNGGVIRSRVDWIWTDEQYFTIENGANQFQESYSIVNANISYIVPHENWEFTFGARNLTDRRYATAARAQGDSGSQFASVGRPREAYAQLTYRFGE